MWTWSKSINNSTPTLKLDWAIKEFYMNENTDTFRYIYPSVRALVGVQNVKVNIWKGPPASFPMSILSQSCKQKAGNAGQCTGQGKNLPAECKSSYAGCCQTQDCESWCVRPGNQQTSLYRLCTHTRQACI